MDKRRELHRQAFHLITGIGIAFLVFLSVLTEAHLLFILLAGLLLAFASKRRDIPVISWFLRKFDRDLVRFPGEGAFFLVLGSFLSLLLFPRNIALASIMILAVGDSFSTLFGIRYGSTPFFKKTLEGSLGGFIPAFFAALFFVNYLDAFLGAAAAMLIEANEFRIKSLKIDDNLLIPLAASLMMTLI